MALQSHKAQTDRAPINMARFDRHFERTVMRAQTSMFLERVFNRVGPPLLGLTATFGAATLGGVWQHVSPSVTITATALVIAGACLALSSLIGMRLPTREEAIARMDQETDGAKRPASTYASRLADSASADQQDLFEALRARLAGQVGRFRAGWPRDPFKLRFALAAAVALFAGVYGHMQNDFEARIAALNPLPLENPNAGPIQMFARVAPPDYTGFRPRVLADVEGTPFLTETIDFAVPEGTNLFVRLDDWNAGLTLEGVGLSADEAGRESTIAECRENSFTDSTDCSITINGPVQITVDKGVGDDRKSLQWVFDIVYDDPPVVTAGVSGADAEDDAEENTGDAMPVIVHEVTDDYQGAEVTGVRIRRPGTDNALPLPLR